MQPPQFTLLSLVDENIKAAIRHRCVEKALPWDETLEDEKLLSLLLSSFNDFNYLFNFRKLILDSINNKIQDWLVTEIKGDLSQKQLQNTILHEAFLLLSKVEYTLKVATRFSERARELLVQETANLLLSKPQATEVIKKIKYDLEKNMEKDPLFSTFVGSYELINFASSELSEKSVAARELQFVLECEGVIDVANKVLVQKLYLFKEQIVFKFLSHPNVIDKIISEKQTIETVVIEEVVCKWLVNHALNEISIAEYHIKSLQESMPDSVDLERATKLVLEAAINIFQIQKKMLEELKNKYIVTSIDRALDIILDKEQKNILRNLTDDAFDEILQETQDLAKIMIKHKNIKGDFLFLVKDKLQMLTKLELKDNTIELAVREIYKIIYFNLLKKWRDKSYLDKDYNKMLAEAMKSVDEIYLRSQKLFLTEINKIKTDENPKIANLVDFLLMSVYMLHMESIDI